ncbi:hypothetical protein B5G34_00865 [Flavonifractor sp. An82]|uniref:hypothetical protein n=1 Tax=Flavonifractor sp. An82 TaxID=1965660 RepID=UPI000B396EC1|nr:hypothetical protein [Flavonifractor sp. An82]OUN23679.1 hypothetical protein B5G34_00865 [Flavonifractor sp. An82]
MISYVEYLNIPVKVAIILIACFFVMQLIGEILEFKGKVVPEFFKIRKHFARKKEERARIENTLQEVKVLLRDVNTRYSDDNIAKRNKWMHWVDSRAKAYDDAISSLKTTLGDVTAALNANTRLTEEMFIQSSRDRIIDFSHRAADDETPISREEFNRIFKVYDQYEKFLDMRGMTNGEINIVYDIIKEAYKRRTETRTFIEGTRDSSE